jgi:hypothetical protein
MCSRYGQRREDESRSGSRRKHEVLTVYIKMPRTTEQKNVIAEM